MIPIWIVFFVIIALIDIRHRIVPNLLVYPAILIALALQLLYAHTDVRVVLLGGGLAFGIFALTAWLKPDSLGGGDVKLAGLIGVLCGFPGVLGALLIGAGTGAGVAVYLMRSNSKQATIPYAPFLCLGAIVLLLVRGV
jgi:leader peptidase (prepilin peptidase) / N-methyltransferase